MIYDHTNQDYVIHWSSAHASNNYGHKAIYYSRTKDFESYTKPQLLYRKEDSGVIDSAIYEENGMFYRFVKSEANPLGIMLQKGESLTGEYTTTRSLTEKLQNSAMPPMKPLLHIS